MAMTVTYRGQTYVVRTEQDIYALILALKALQQLVA